MKDIEKRIEQCLERFYRTGSLAHYEEAKRLQNLLIDSDNGAVVIDASEIASYDIGSDDK